MSETTKKVNGGGISETEVTPPITVGNPAAAASLAINQSHMEDYANPEAQSSIVECKRPAKGQFFTVLPETGEPWQNRKYYWMLTLEGRDPFIVAPSTKTVVRSNTD